MVTVAKAVADLVPSETVTLVLNTPGSELVLCSWTVQVEPEDKLPAHVEDMDQLLPGLLTDRLPVGAPELVTVNVVPPIVIAVASPHRMSQPSKVAADGVMVNVPDWTSVWGGARSAVTRASLVSNEASGFTTPASGQ
jgi:hypothetical protein